MLRFTFRSRRKEARRSAAQRSRKSLETQSPPQPETTCPSSGAPASYLVNYDTLPVRRPDGKALNYDEYQPSPYFTPSPASRTRRRARAAKEPRVAASTSHRPNSVANDLGLDFDTLQRNKAIAPVDDILQLIPIEKRIRIKIAELRDLFRQSDELGTIEALKELVSTHSDNLSTYSVTVQTAGAQLKEAKAITGVNEKSVRYSSAKRNPLIRRVPGKPGRHIGDRTASGIKLRTASMRSVSRVNQKSLHEHRNDDNRPPGREHKPPGPSKGKIELNKLTRKSSARLRRLGSAGSLLIRRLSKVSVAEDTSTGSSGEAPISSIFDQEALKRLKENPIEVIASYEADLKQAQLAADIEADKLHEAKVRLQERRDIHDKVMALLDQFYGSLPGWEDDPISLNMLPDTADMTEAGIEAERDLAEVRLMRERIFAAYEDHGRALTALRVVSTSMSLFVERLETIVSPFDNDGAEAYPQDDLVNINQEATSEAFAYLESLMRKCAHNGSIAGICSVEAPRVDQIARDVGKLDEGFRRESHAVIRRGAIYRNGFLPTLRVSKSTLCDCKLAETFVAERRKMIWEDLDAFDEKVERYEEYVILERTGILDVYHPSRGGR